RHRTPQVPQGESRVPDVRVAGTRIHYEVAGTGSPVILLHGIGSNSRSWRRQLSGLSADFQVIAWDAPGYGQSADPPGHPAIPSTQFYTECLHGLLELLGLKRSFLVGHSMGGAVAQEFYRSYPSFVGALILADTRVRPTADLEDRLKSIRTMT